MTTAMIRVELPYHLQNLARVGAEVSLEVAVPVSAAAILDALETRYPMLCGTIRDHVTKQRRPFLRYFCCQKDVSQDPPEVILPEAVMSGAEPFIIWGALAGG